MKIYTHITMRWDGIQYVDIDATWKWYDGPVDLCCGASGAQQQLQGEQMSAYNTMTSQASQVFGNSSTVFSDLMNTFAPTVAAGPNQQGFSPGELSALNSQAITETGQAYRNAKAAVGDAQSAQGGGNLGDVTTGATTGTNLGLAESAANQTSSQLGQINLQNYQVGRQNYDTAASGLAGAPNVFNEANNAANAATNSGNAASNTANAVSQQNNSWVQAVSGALGAAAGAAATGGMNMLANAGNSSNSDSSPGGVPQSAWDSSAVTF